MEQLRGLTSLVTAVAARLVSDELRRMLGAGAEVVVTVQPEPRALLGNGRPPRRKPGPKPGRRRGRPRNATKAATRGERREAGRAARASVAADTGAMVRTCRKCFRRGPIAVSDGNLAKCQACGFTWRVRASRVDTPAPKGKAAPVRRPKDAGADVCGRCDHDKSAHIGANGACLVPRCSCAGFYE